jgi:undecaprenyl phosphate-alpha-L-ara4N flippase subunit ArnE
MMNLRFMLILLAYVTTSATGLVLMRAELRRPDVALVSAASATNWRLLLALALYAASFGFWLLALARYPLTTAYPVFIGVGYAAVTVCAVVFLDERITSLKLAGIVCIGAGLLLVMDR